jgi:hypothetical protein
VTLRRSKPTSRSADAGSNLGSAGYARCIPE